MQKTVSGYQIRKCQRPECGMRYPYADHYTFGERCPRCRAETTVVHQGALQADIHPSGETSIGEGASSSTKPARMEALLDNVRSAWNVGSIFRSADGVGMGTLYLCGITPNPVDHPGIEKTSLGAEKSIPWRHALDGVELAIELLDSGRQLWALETDERADSLYEVTLATRENPVVLVVGNEVCGVDPGILTVCQRTIRVPMKGVKHSLNVAIAFGIAAHYLGWTST